MDMFNSEQAVNFLRNKRVVVIGDSIQRSIYKDLIRLLVPDPTSTYLTDQHLKTKGELEFLGDKLLQGGQLGEMKNGINYREVRQYNNESTVVRFYFVTRCYSDYTKSILHGIKCMRPHAIIMNSCLWDLHRYGLHGPLQYIDNMHKLMFELKKVIHSTTVFIWNATLPLDSKCKGGFLLPYVDNIPAQEIIGANFVAADIVRSHGFVFLDLYSVLMHRIDLRETDGIHWNALANRIITSHILILLSYAWKLPISKPNIQDPRVHHPHLEFSSKMQSDFRHYFGLIPTIRDPPYDHPLSQFSNDPLPSYWRSLLYNNDIPVLKNIENSAHYEHLLRDHFVGRNASTADNLALIGHARNTPRPPLDKPFIHALPSPQMSHTTFAHTHHTPPAFPLDKPFIHPLPSPQMSHTTFAHTHHTPPASPLDKPFIHPSPSPQMSHTTFAHTHHTPPASPLDKLFIHPSPSPQMSHTTFAHTHHTPPASPLDKPFIHPLPSPQMSHTTFAHTHHTPPASPLDKPFIHPSPSPQMSHTTFAHTHHTLPAFPLDKLFIHPLHSPQMSHTTFAHTHHTPPAFPLDKPFIHPLPSPQMSHITSVHDRQLLGLPTGSPSIPEALRRQDHFYYKSVHSLILPRPMNNQHSSSPQVSEAMSFST